MKFVMRRSLSVFLAVAMAFSFVLVPKVALAENFPSQILYESVDPLVSRNYIVLANSNFACAACVLGTDDQLLTAEQKSYLSDPNYCPNFCAVADSFSPWDIASSPDWIPNYMFALLSVGYMMMYGTRYVGAVNYETYSHAKLELVDVLNGNYPDGGGGDVDTSDGLEFTFTIGSGNYYYSSNYMTNPQTGRSGNVVISLTSDMCDTLRNYNYVGVCLHRASGNNVNNDTANYGITVVGHNNANPDVQSVANSRSYAQMLGTVNTFGLNSQTIPTWLSNVSAIGNGVYSTNGYKCQGWDLWFTNYTIDEFLNGGGGSDSEPEGNWPDEPETVSPTPPDVPNPSNNTEPTEPSTPGITIDLPEINFTPGVDPTDLTDVTDWLRTINHNIVLINENLDAALNEIVNAFEAVGVGLDDIYYALATHCGHIRDSIDSNIYELEEYLQDLFEWLAEELDFTFTGSDYEGYDDSSVLSYLRRILNKLNNPSNPNYQPNPIANPDDFFKWLNDLLANLWIDLMSIAPSKLLDLIDLFSQLTHYFPISIPWDIAALLGLFVHDPVIPVFTIPFPWGADHVENITIDLTLWDPVATMIRPVILAIFCLQLALLTRDLLSGLSDVTSGGV